MVVFMFLKSTIGGNLHVRKKRSRKHEVRQWPATPIGSLNSQFGRAGSQPGRPRRIL